VLERVLESNTATAAPLHCQSETSGSETKQTHASRVLLVNTVAALVPGQFEALLT